ncbi:MAG TPA: hypothetical protein VGE46_06830, partial [Bdellovibrio sp.]
SSLRHSADKLLKETLIEMSFLLPVTRRERCRRKVLVTGLTVKAIDFSGITFTQERSVRGDKFPRFGRLILSLAIRTFNRHTAKDLRKALANNNLGIQF